MLVAAKLGLQLSWSNRVDGRVVEVEPVLCESALGIRNREIAEAEVVFSCLVGLVLNRLLIVVFLLIFILLASLFILFVIWIVLVLLVLQFLLLLISHELGCVKLLLFYFCGLFLESSCLL